MSLRVAFASSDGVNVDAHFGKSGNFFIYEVSGSGSSFIEARLCEIPDQPEKHLETKAKLLHDCLIIVAQKFGRHALLLFIPSRVELLELDGPIETHLVELQKLIKVRRKFRLLAGEEPS